MALNLVSIGPDAPYLDMLARRWLAAHPDHPERGTILLPTRRAARSLAVAFLEIAGGRPMLLPRITALGGLDDGALTLLDDFDLPPAIAALPRDALLARMILKLPPEQGGARTLDQALLLGAELARLLDEADRAGIDLRGALAGAVDAEHALHWETTLRFMHIVTGVLPAVLAELGVASGVARQVRLLQLQADAWAEQPPAEPVWAAGLTGAIPAVARLLGVIAGMRHGQVVLSGLDFDLDEAVWRSIDDTHPQAGLARLLDDIGARRDDVQPWTPEAPTRQRSRLLSRALLPASALAEWRIPAAPDLSGLHRLTTADQHAEAVAIAMILRDALQTPGRRAALVTPDRALATRVSAELLRWGVVADDSAGEPLIETPPAVFLRLLARAVVDALAPVALLSVLKHPYAALGLAPAACRAAARGLELACLRGPKPPPGLTGLKRSTAAAAPDVADLVARLEDRLAPLLRVAAGLSVAPRDALAALVATGEALADTDAEPGAGLLWAREEGVALADLLAEAMDALADLPEIGPAELPELLDALLQGAVVRSRRALRGRGEAQEHPRVFIWGLLEARLQNVDTLVLGGLSESVWPAAADPGPWMSRPMRARAGLPSPEENVGLAAHDFVASACAAEVVVLSCPRRRDGAPTVPSRWLARIDAYLQGQGTRLPEHPASTWATRLDQPEATVPVRPPEPRPAVALRPRQLSATEIETWLADPYAIYARHILRLRQLDPLEQATDAADYGSLVHAGLHRFLRAVGTTLPPDSGRQLREAMDTELLAAGVRPALAAWWRPRLHRIADWVVTEETERRAAVPPMRIGSELKGAWQVPVPGGFTLVARADRMELRADGLIAILDYKTGAVPSQKDVAAGFSPQLTLEAAMASEGAFGPEFAGPVGALTYWRITGGAEPGRAHELFRTASALEDVVQEARENLAHLVIAFDRPERAYLAQPHPGHRPRFSAYGQLARVAEWDLSGPDAA